METTQSSLPLWSVLISLGVVPLIVLSDRRPNLREAWTLLAAVAKFALVCVLVAQVRRGEIIECQLWEIVPGVSLSFRVDPLGAIFGAVASGLWILTSIYSIGYVRAHGERKQTRYFAAFAVSLSATLGVAFAANLITFLVFYELLTLATYPLVIHSETPEARRAGRQYLAYSLSGGLLILAAVIWTYQIVGHLDFRPGGILSGWQGGRAEHTLLFCLFLAGFGVKAAVMPLHSWLPNAMVAPTPVSALLHAVAVVKSGVFGVLRLLGFIFGPGLMGAWGLDAIVLVLAGGTVVLGSVLALQQDSLKRLLAYSTISQLSYIILGAALLSVEGFVGGVFHLTTHALMKITLFFCAGAIAVHAHKTKVSELDGVGRSMPWTMGAFTVAALGMIGIPPVNGFFSKWFLCTGAAAGGDMAVLAVLLISGLLNGAYFLPIIYRAFFCGKKGSAPYDEAGLGLVLPLSITAGLTLLWGLWPDLALGWLELARDVAVAVSRGGGELLAETPP